MNILGVAVQWSAAMIDVMDFLLVSELDSIIVPPIVRANIASGSTGAERGHRSANDVEPRNG